MNDEPKSTVSRGQIAVRLVFTLLFIALYSVLNIIVILTILVQYVFLFITLQHSEPVRIFANKVISYAYRIRRYITLNENRRPFPFTEFPEEMETPEAEITFP